MCLGESVCSALPSCAVAVGCHALEQIAGDADGTVVWVEEQQKAAHDGDVRAEVRLADLIRHSRFYAMGRRECITTVTGASECVRTLFAVFSQPSITPI